MLTNGVNNPRVFLIDPNLVIGTGLPYAQTNTGAATVQSPRFIIMSSLSPAAARRASATWV